MVLEKKYYSPREAAAISGLSQKALRAGCKEGRFPHIMAGRNYKIDLAGVFAVLDHEGKQTSA